MKKFVTILTTALIFCMCSTTVVSARHMNRRNFVDADGDGVCDNYSHNSNGCGRHSNCGKGYVDADGDGVCDNYDSNCKGYVDADGDGVCDNIKYTIKYNLNGGKNNKKNPTCYYNGKSVKLKNPTRKNYVFKGWYTDKNYKNKVTTIKKGSVGKKTLYAKWKKK